MKITFKVPQQLVTDIRLDLRRPHPFAAERVGFVVCRFGVSTTSKLLILALQYVPVADEDYVKDYRYGALLGPEGFRKAFQFAFSNDVGIFHVHLHDHQGRPGFSRIDKQEMAKYVPDFFNVRSNLPHGALVLSQNSLAGSCWMGRRSREISIHNFHRWVSTSLR
jgi:hypothetical protein